MSPGLCARWAIALAVGTAVWLTGRHTLGAPPLLDPARLPLWSRQVGPLLAVFACARVALLLVAGCWAGLLLIVTAAGVAGVGRRTRLVRAPRLVHLALGLTATGGVLSGCAASGPGPVPPPVLTYAGPAPAAAYPPVPHPGSLSGSEPAAPPGAGDRRWVVRAGDNLWSISALALAAATGASRPVPQRAVAAYWLEVIRINRAALPDPTDPNLLFPGDVITLPPIR